jgi:hypothetical protein
MTTGAWTPTDASGASLTFSTATGEYTQIGNVVFANCIIVYPATASGATAVIGGLPVATGAGNQQQGGNISFSTVATLASVKTNAGATTAQFYTTNGTAITNVTLTTATLFLSFQYFAS